MQVIHELESGNQTIAIQVPCEGCRLCCYGFRTGLTDKEAENPVYKAVRFRGHWIIPKKNNACIHLTEGGCGIFEDTPLTCRGFDCRERMVAGMTDKLTVEMAEQWDMSRWYKESNALFLDSIRTAAATKKQVAPETPVSELTIYAITRWPEYLGVVSSEE